MVRTRIGCVQLPPLSDSATARADKWSAWIDFGTLPDWIAGVSGFLAFCAASLAVWFAARAFRLQARQIEMLETENRAKQASRVGVWIKRDGDGEAYFHVVNNSELPIYVVALWVTLPDPAHGLRQFYPTISPGEHDFPIGEEIPQVSGPVMTFGDSSQTYWMRGPFGDLDIIDNDVAVKARRLIPADGFTQQPVVEMMYGHVPPPR